MIAFVTSADRSRAKKKQLWSRKDQKERKVKVWHMRARGFIRTPLICDLRGNFYAAIWWDVRLLIMTHFLQCSFALISCEWSNKWSQCCAMILRMKNCKRLTPPQISYCVHFIVTLALRGGRRRMKFLKKFACLSAAHLKYFTTRRRHQINCAISFHHTFYRFSNQNISPS